MQVFLHDNVIVSKVPITSANPPSVMMFTLWPVKYSATRAAVSERGIANPTTSAALMLRRNRKIISPANPAPSIPSFCKFAMACLM